ncbi:RNA polymerase sigma factor, partial [Patulibacter brassicae]
MAARVDAEAFARIYAEHHDALSRYCRSIVRDEEDARDALQSAMTKAFAALQEERRSFELRPWLFRIVHNEALSLVRRRRPTTDLDAAYDVGRDDLERTVETRERLAHLRGDLAALPERQRSALLLRELVGLSLPEIAQVLDVGERGVKQTIYEARRALLECDEGRALACEEAQQALSDGDGRTRRGRRLRAHVRSCDACRRFEQALLARPAQLQALAPPLPLAAAGGLLAAVTGGSAAAVGGATAGGSAAIAGGGAAV